MQSVKFEYERVHDNICNNVMPISISVFQCLYCVIVSFNNFWEIVIYLYVLYILCAFDIVAKYLFIWGMLSMKYNSSVK